VVLSEKGKLEGQRFLWPACGISVSVVAHNVATTIILSFDNHGIVARPSRRSIQCSQPLPTACQIRSNDVRAVCVPRSSRARQWPQGLRWSSPGREEDCFPVCHTGQYHLQAKRYIPGPCLNIRRRRDTDAIFPRHEMAPRRERGHRQRPHHLCHRGRLRSLLPRPEPAPETTIHRRCIGERRKALSPPYAQERGDTATVGHVRHAHQGRFVRGISRKPS
jgi:hypothetical protein